MQELCNKEFKKTRKRMVLMKSIQQKNEYNAKKDVYNNQYNVSNYFTTPKK